MLSHPRAALAAPQDFGQSRIAVLRSPTPSRADQLTVCFHHLLALALSQRIKAWCNQYGRTQGHWARLQGFEESALSRVLNGRAYMPSGWLGPLWDLGDPDLVPTEDEVKLLVPRVQPSPQPQPFPAQLRYTPPKPLPARGFDLGARPDSAFSAPIASADAVAAARDDLAMDTPGKEPSHAPAQALERIAHRWIVYSHATHPGIAPQERAETPTVEVVVRIASPAAPAADGSLLTGDCFLHLDVAADWESKVHDRGHALIDGHIVLDIIDEQDGRPNYVVAVRDIARINVAVYADVAWVRWDPDGPRLRWSSD